MRHHRRLLACFVAVSLGLLVPVAVAATVPGQSAGYQSGPGHDGLADTAAPPLDQAWTRSFGGPSSYPVIAGGRAFVTVKTNPNVYGTQLIALDLATGTQLWAVDLHGTYWWSAPAYDSGRVYALNFDGVLAAFDPATGAQLWSVRLPGQYAFSSAPTATGGRVYVSGAGSGGTLYSVDGATGAVQWTQPVANGDESSPAVADGRVYVGYACQQAYGFDAVSGAALWHHTTSCSGGGGKTIAVAGSNLYVRDNVLGNVVLSATSGAATGTFTAGPIPAFDATRGYFVANGVVTAIDRAKGRTAWSVSGLGVTSAPLVSGGVVFVGTSSGVLALDATTGATAWSAPLSGGVPAPDEQNVSQPLTGLAAAGGYLLVPTGTALVAFHEHADFTVAATPTSLRLKRNATGRSTVTVTAQGPFSGAVTLTLSGAPGTVQASVAPTAVQVGRSAPGSATVSVTAGSKAATFTLTVHACAQTLCHDAAVAVQVG